MWVYFHQDFVIPIISFFDWNLFYCWTAYTGIANYTIFRECNNSYSHQSPLNTSQRLTISSVPLKSPDSPDWPFTSTKLITASGIQVTGVLSIVLSIHQIAQIRDPRNDHILRTLLSPSGWVFWTEQSVDLWLELTKTKEKAFHLILI